MKRKTADIIDLSDSFITEISPLNVTKSNKISTPETNRLVEICRDIERDYIKIFKNGEENSVYKEKYYLISQENQDLNRKILELEQKIAEKDLEIKYLNIDNKFPFDNKRCEIIKSEHIENINILRKCILGLKDENKRLLNNSLQVDILKEKLDTAESTIKSQNKQIEIYKEKLEEMANRTPNKIAIQQELEFKSLSIEYEKCKVDNETLAKKISESEAKNEELMTEIQRLQDSIKDINKYLKVKDREIEKVKSQLSRVILVRDGYREILDSYSSLSFDDVELEVFLKNRIQKLESLCIGLGDECTKLEIANSILKTKEDANESNLCQCITKYQSTFNDDRKNIQLNEERNRILHKTENPHSIYERTITQKYNDIVLQNENFLTTIRLLTQDIKSNSTINQNAIFNKVLQILNKLPLASEFDKLKDEAYRFKTLSARYKQVCYEKIKSLRHDFTKLLGYDLEYQDKDNTIKLISIYSQNPEQHLIFNKLEDGKTFELIQNDFANSIKPELEKYKDFPSLNAAINLKLKVQ